MPELIPMFADHSHLEIHRILNTALRCGNCGAHQSRLIFKSEGVTRPRYVVACTECDHHGPFGKTLHDAIKQWNKPPGFFAAFFQRRRK